MSLTFVCMLNMVQPNGDGHIGLIPMEFARTWLYDRQMLLYDNP